MRILERNWIAATNQTYTFQSTSQQLQHIWGYAIHAKWTNNTPGSGKTFDSPAKASVAIADLTYEADTAGTAGNSITVEYTGGASHGSEVVTVVGSAITCQLEDGVSTATEVKTAIDAYPAAAALVNITVTGTGSNAQNITAATPLTGGVNSEIDVTANTLTIPSHGYIAGPCGQLTTTGTLPATLATGTDYYVIVVDANKIKLATTLAYALAGTAVNITDEGIGVGTYTPSAISGSTIKLQASNDEISWIDIASTSQNITGTSEYMWNVTDAAYGYVRAYVTIGTGLIDMAASINCKGIG